MGKVRRRAKLAAWVLALSGTGLAQAAQPTPADMLRFKPTQQGVTIAVPTEAEAASLKVELVTGPGPATGWALKDARGNLIRKFVASKGNSVGIDTWSYYLDGQEVYRDVLSAPNPNNKQQRPDQYRWLNAGGSKWGVDVNGDTRIDGWRQISPEEVSQELLRSILTKDVGRFQALLINEAEIKSLDLAATESQRMVQSVAQAPAKFQQAVQAIGSLSDKTQWVHFEAQVPQCIPADQAGGKQDLVRYQGATLLYQDGTKHDWVTLGDLVQVGRAWRLVAAPTPGNNTGGPIAKDPSGTDPVKLTPEGQEFVNQLNKLDQAAPSPADAPAVIAKHNLARAAILEKIIAVEPVGNRETWIKQLADTLSTAAQNSAPGERAAQIRLTALREQLSKSMAGTPLVGYVAFRELSAEYNLKVSNVKKNEEVGKIQDWWCETLKAFVQTYPNAEDAPDAHLQIGMVSEFMGKETDAKTWYSKLAKDFAQDPRGAKAAGALKRLALEGQPMELAGPTMNGQNFNIAQLQNKVVVVYYWASWNNQCESDLNKIRDQIVKGYASKGVELVTVNLDDNVAGAQQALQKTQVPGIHLHQPGGLDSPLAVKYGVMVLPNIFLVGKDGKVVNRTVQMSSLEDEVKKLTEK